MNDTRAQKMIRRRRALRRRRIVAAGLAAALLIALATVAVVTLYHRPQGAKKPPTSGKPAFTLTLDTSASADATVTPRSIPITGGKLSVDRLPFATAPGLRFIGWFSGPAGDAAARQIDNTMLSQIATDTSTTLYARFETHPIGVDRSVHGLPILMYHDFYDPAKGEQADPAEKGNMLNLDSFAEQLDYLKKENYYFPSWEEVYAYVKGDIRLPDKSVVLTSDDGRPDVFDKAYPLLVQKQARMTSFVIGSMAVDNKLDLSKIDPRYLDIRSHTYGLHHRDSVAAGGRITHVDFATIAADVKEESAVVPQRFVMAYPYGQQDVDFNAATEAALQKLGFSLAVSTNKGLVYPGQDPMALHRRGVFEPTSLAQFKILLSAE